MVAVYGCESGVKCQYLESLSTTTIMIGLPLQLGKPLSFIQEISLQHFHKEIYNFHLGLFLYSLEKQKLEASNLNSQ